MSHTQITLLVVAAVLAFWMVGAYNRLVDLRNRIAEAWQLVDEVLVRRGDAVAALVAALRAPLAGEQGALDALLSAQAQVRAAADALKTRPVMASLAAALQAAETTMSAASARVLALLEAQPELRGEAAVVPHAQLLRDSAGRLAFTRQMFNDAAQAYNAAARQFPTRLLARLYGFGTAGRL